MGKMQPMAWLLAACLLTACSDVKPPAVETTRRAETTDTTADLAAPEASIPAALPPDSEGQGVILLDGTIALRTISIPAEHCDTLPLDDTRRILVMYDRMRDKDGNLWLDEGSPVYTNIRIALYDTLRGELGAPIPLSGGIYPSDISYEADGIILYTIEYDASGAVYYPAWKLDPDSAAPTLTPVRFDGARAMEARCASPDGQWTACRRSLDLMGDHEIILMDPAGHTQVILESHSFAETGDVQTVVGYNPVGWLDGERLFLQIIGWEGMRGYGIYHALSGKMEEFPCRGSWTPILYGGTITALDMGYGEFSGIYTLSPAGEQTLLIGGDSPLIPAVTSWQAAYRSGEYWIFLQSEVGLEQECYIFDGAMTRRVAHLHSPRVAVYWHMMGDYVVVLTTESR